MAPRVLSCAISLMFATAAIAGQRPSPASRAARATTGVDPAVEISANLRSSTRRMGVTHPSRRRQRHSMGLRYGAIRRTSWRWSPRETATWYVLAGTMRLGDIRRTALDAASIPWRIRTPALASAGGGDLDRIKAVLSRSMLPIGRVVDSSVWRTVLAESPEVRVSSGVIPAHWLRVASVGSRAADPNVLIPVSGQEPVTVASIGAAPGTCLQLLLQPLDNSRVWPMPTCGHSHGSRWSDILYIGRSGYPAADALDLFTKFAATAIATTKQLPVSPRGLSPAEFAEDAPFIRAMSTRVTLVRGDYRLRRAGRDHAARNRHRRDGMVGGAGAARRGIVRRLIALPITWHCCRDAARENCRLRGMARRGGGEARPQPRLLGSHRGHVRATGRLSGCSRRQRSRHRAARTDYRSRALGSACLGPVGRNRFSRHSQLGGAMRERVYGSRVCRTFVVAILLSAGCTRDPPAHRRHRRAKASACARATPSTARSRSA